MLAALKCAIGFRSGHWIHCWQVDCSFLCLAFFLKLNNTFQVLHHFFTKLINYVVFSSLSVFATLEPLIINVSLTNKMIYEKLYLTRHFVPEFTMTDLRHNPYSFPFTQARN